MNTFATRLVQAKQARRISYAALAAAVGAPDQTVFAWKKGAMPSRTHMARLAVALGVPAGWLETGEMDRISVGSAEAVMVAQAFEALPVRRRKLLLAMFEDWGALIPGGCDVD
ncbi:helix-turn-helix domain-containing protein [Laribacter hongkongensis]|uniref:helix-turn-helix domain-containing protein n=1 Tax=Laribacter hongkongensis TaxID=168471 RepID=UPI0004833695|nr:helix-turn-helix domain-containing protein [Laribacter hongkongensis]